MKTIPVTASRNYEVLVGSHILAELPKHIYAQKVAIVSDRNVWALHGCKLQQVLTGAGFPVVSFVFSPGENSKNADTFLQILNFFAQTKLTRTDCVIALGGGVVGDLAGFAAACYLRGIPYVQVPTTLLAMVDSSVGGKTGIDLPAGKNLAGAFYQPSFVLCDTAFLDTLPEEEFRSGCAEVIKYGVLFDEVLFAELEASGLDFDREAVIARCIEHKRNIVADDEFDQGNRRLLNLGHTLGHAIEAESGYQISHGQAVAIGMTMAAKNTPCGQQICALLTQFGLPTKTEFSAEALHRWALGDKKAQGDHVHVIIPREIGSCQIVPMDSPQLLDFIKAGL